MQRCLVAFLLLATTLGFGCASSGGSRTLSRVVESGTLRVGMSGEQPPLNMTTKTNELIGLEVALMRVLAANMGVTPEFVTRPFGELLGALEAGEVDLVMSGMTITPRRNLRVAFVGPYFVSGKSLLSKSRVILSLQSPEDLNQPDFRFAALAGSTSEEFVKRVAPNATLKITPSLDQAVNLVVTDEADALVADLETCFFARLRNPGAGLEMLPTPLTVEPIGIALPANDPLFVNLMQNFVNAVEATDSVQRSLQFWLRDPSWIQLLR
jgi:polar amino acid transport system substrate-binding protein